MGMSPMTIEELGTGLGAVPADLTDEWGAPEALAVALAVPHEVVDDEDPIEAAIFVGLVTP